MMLTYLLCAGLATIVLAQVVEGGVIGLCVEECSNSAVSRALGSGSCQEGYECRSNGCGHTCQKVTELNRAVKRPCSLVMCDIFCENGLDHDENGCSLCKCKAVVS